MPGDVGFITAIVTAGVGAIGTLVVMIIRAMRADRPSPPDSMPGIGPELREATTAIAELRDLMRRQELGDAKESVHDAETRRLVSDIASALQALVVAADRDRGDAQRDRAEIRAELRALGEHIRALATDVRAIVARRDRSSRP